MCSIANLLNANIRKIDAKKTYFFCPECLNRMRKSLGKTNFFKSKIIVLEVEL